ncbi:MAG: hypothetical protein IH884_12090 [Myxococcales bacterium]|nr:hypothetical protein [Myxococcales bacterium]
MQKQLARTDLRAAYSPQKRTGESKFLCVSALRGLSSHAAGLDRSRKTFGIGPEVHLELARLASGTDRLANNPERLGAGDPVETLERIA